MSWTENDLSLCKEMWENSQKTQKEISCFFGKCKSSIPKIAKKMGWNKRKKGAIILHINFKEKRIFSQNIGVHISKIKDNQCRDIIGDPKNGMMCGVIVKDGSSYCNNHHSINHIKTTFTGEK